MLISSLDNKEFQQTEITFELKFDTKDFGRTKKILNMKFIRDKKLILLKSTQKEYIVKVLLV